MKVKFSDSINPFGGLNFVIKSIEDIGIGDLLNKELPDLANQSKYNWSDILYTFWSIYFCGGDCIEDCNKNFKHYLKTCPFFQVCSPDRILDRFKELSIPKILAKSKQSTKQHEFSLNKSLNHLCIKVLKKTSCLAKHNNILDYDNTMLFTKKDDSAKTYHKARGYNPGVAFLNNQIVYVENRNGNSDGGSLQTQTLERLFELLKEEDIKINCFRADSASYQWNVLKLIKEEVDLFYLSARRTADLARAIADIDVWEDIKVGNDLYLRGEAKYIPFKSSAEREKETEELIECRIIVTKTARKDKQIDFFSKEAFKYRVILTNDFESSVEDVLSIYRQRGATEKEFDILKNDFGWKSMPFSKLEQNTVHLIFCAMCRNIYDYIIKKYSKSYKWLNKTFRIKKFIYRFISVPAKWVRHARQETLIVYGMMNLKSSSP